MGWGRGGGGGGELKFQTEKITLITSLAKIYGS